MNGSNFFHNSNLAFSPLGEIKTQEQLCKEFPFEFYGKNDFVQFYLTYNGVFFPDGAKISRSNLHNIGDEDFDELEVECFYDIGGRLERMWETTKKISPEAGIYTQTHIPFAGDSAGNEYWIEIPSGHIKYVSWEYGLPNGEILVALNFRNFCSLIQSLDL